MIPINKPSITKEDIDAVVEVMKESALTSAHSNGGKQVQKLEKQLAVFLKVKHVVAVNSGTAALHAALLAAGIGPGDEVIIPSLTFVATANAVVAVGAKPVFADVKKDDYTIDVFDIEPKITAKTKAIIPVHIYGHPCDMDMLDDLAVTYGLDIIEDACQSLGSTYQNKQTGTIGAMGCFSMYASKVLTAGEGGFIATDFDEYASKLKMIRNHGMVEGYDTQVPGLNLRLPEVCAAIANVQLKNLPGYLALRSYNAEILSELLEQEGLLTLPKETKEKKFNWYLFTVAINEDRDRLKNFLLKSDIGATVYYSPPVHKTPYYKTVSNASLPVTEWCSDHLLCLPVHPSVGPSDLRWITEVLLKYKETFN